MDQEVIQIRSTDISKYRHNYEGFYKKSDGYHVAYKPMTFSCISFMFIEMKFIHCHSYVMFSMKFISICIDDETKPRGRRLQPVSRQKLFQTYQF